MGSEGVVIPASAVDQDLRIRGGSEQLGVEKLISELAVERLTASSAGRARLRFLGVGR